jgi:hypothetical protein
MIQNWLLRTSRFNFAVYAILAAFGTYFCMYGFRKTFTAAGFEGLSLWGIDYKILLVTVQVFGYMLAKFIGIKIISELKARSRVVLLLSLVAIAEVALLLFAAVPQPYNFIFLFFNGLPLGMIWGIVFSYLEGRTTSDTLGAGLSVSFVVSSGAVKTVGKSLMVNWGISQFWMPFVAGLLFTLPLLLFTYLLNQLPPPNAEDIAERTKREPMTAAQRRAFVLQFAFGLTMLVLFYVFLTAYRSFRDDFANELWTALDPNFNPAIFTQTELPIALLVFAAITWMMRIRNNQKAFIIYHWVIIASCILIAASTLLFQNKMLAPFPWMVCVGLGAYMCYVPYNCVLFDRMIAAFRVVANSGFLIYVADSFGYLGSVTVMLYKNFGQPDLSWLDFFIRFSYILAGAGVLTVIASVFYFAAKFRATASRVNPVVN